MQFLIRTVTHQDLKDSGGRLIPTVIAEHISDQAKDDIAAAAHKDEDAVLAFIGSNPAASWASIAIAMGWKLFNGDPHKTKAARCIKALVKAKLVKPTRSGHYKLTPERKGTKRRGPGMREITRQKSDQTAFSKCRCRTANRTGSGPDIKSGPMALKQPKNQQLLDNWLWSENDQSVSPDMSVSDHIDP